MLKINVNKSDIKRINHLSFFLWTVPPKNLGLSITVVLGLCFSGESHKNSLKSFLASLGEKKLFIQATEVSFSHASLLLSAVFSASS